MQDYRRGSHAVWDCKYHLVWTTKYHYQVSSGDVGLRCRELLREIAMSKEMHIYAGSINRDQVHGRTKDVDPIALVLAVVDHLGYCGGEDFVSGFCVQQR